MTSSARSSLLLLMWGAVAAVLLIGCTNVANLVLARSIARRQELTIRVAIGAGRGRLARQLLAENTVLASLGAIVGVGLAYLLVDALRAVGPAAIPRLQEVTVDSVAVAWAAALAVLTGLGFGVWPLRHLHHVDLVNDLNESARTAVSGLRQTRRRQVLLITEISLSLVLLTGAGLLIASLVRLQQVDPGFRPDHVLTASVDLAGARYDGHERISSVVRELTEQIAAVPGIQAAAAGTGIPLGHTGWGKFFSIDGRPTPSSLAEIPNVEYRQVTPDYFRAMGATLSRGRAMGADDDARRPPVATVNETLARRFWPNEDPLGRRVSLAPPEPLIAAELAEGIAAGQLPAGFREFPRFTVVGVVRDVRERGLDADVAPTVYVPYAQALPPSEEPSGSFFLVVRTATDPLAYRKPIEAVVKRIDADLPLAAVRTMDDRLAESLARRRFAMLLLGAFAVVALVLVVAGLYRRDGLCRQSTAARVRRATRARRHPPRSAGPRAVAGPAGHGDRDFRGARAGRRALAARRGTAVRGQAARSDDLRCDRAADGDGGGGGVRGARPARRAARSRDDAAARVKAGRQAEAPGMRLRKPHLHTSRARAPSI